MKQVFIVSIIILALFPCCGIIEDLENNTVKDEKFISNSYNGDFVIAFSQAYDYFLENDEMPGYINVQGIKYYRGHYMAAACILLKKIINEPESWQKEDIEIIAVSCPDNLLNNTFNRDSLSLKEVQDIIEKVYDYAVLHKVFPNYCTVETNYIDKDGSVYSTKIIINSLSVIVARLFSFYTSHSRLPEKVCAWHSVYLKETNNCSLSDELVLEELRKAIKGKNTDYEKAKAIFEHVRDEYEYEFYSNSSKGAVGTIKAKAGNCCDLSHLIVSLARASGFPARYKHAQCQYSSQVYGHVMAEIYVDGKWFLSDASNNINTFGNHEAWKYMKTFNGYYNSLPF